MSGKIIDVSDNLNFNGDRYAYNPTMQVYKNELYCVWEESNDYTGQVKIKKYNEFSWMEVSSSLNYNEKERAFSPKLQVYKDELYCIWNEKPKQQISIKKYNGASWTNISSSLNYNENNSALNPTMQVYKDELYCAWTEWDNGGKVKIKKFNGNTWTNISGNLNYDANRYANNPIMQVYKDELYVTWFENYEFNGSDYQIKVKKYNGNTWTNISNCLNYNAKENAQYSSMQVYKNELYCAWSERNNDDSNYHIKMKKYNGVSWEEVSNNFNYIENANLALQTFQVYKDELYCIWRGYNGSNAQIKIKKYDGNGWINISDNLNYEKNKNVSYPSMQVYRDGLYCAWQEKSINDFNWQIKMKKYILSTEKFLIKQNDKYISIKPEFYKNGQYQPLILEGDITPNDNDFINNGFEDLDDLCKEVSVENNIIKVKSNASDYEQGKMFSFDIDSEFKNINTIE